MKFWFWLFIALHVRFFYFIIWFDFQAYKRDNAGHNDHGSVKPQSEFDQVANDSFLSTIPSKNNFFEIPLKF